MCGIAVVVAAHPEQAHAALERMTCAQVHRGPDDQGHELVNLNGVVLGLGQRRLSIIDLSPLGRQPMAHEASGDLIVFNGEIYNFQSIRQELESRGARFRGHSDTEVLLEGLVSEGTSLLSRLRGMFSIAWFRRAQRTLVLARDPLGIKPLYYARTPGGFVAASEIRAILASGFVERRVCRRGLATFLAFGAVQDPDTIVEGVRSFAPGSFIEIPLDRPDSVRLDAPTSFWRIPPVDHGIDEAAATRGVREALETAVREHLISDVPVGLFLSGGIDSTIIAGLAARHAPDLRSYTVGFDDHADMSETGPAQRTAQAFDLPHVDVQITTPQAASSVEKWLDALDQPSIDGLNTFVVAGAVKNAGITVALSGLGGDELFAGYGSFTDVPRLHALMRNARHMPRWLRTIAARAASVGKPVAYRDKLREIARTNGALADLYFQRRRVMSERQLALLGVSERSAGLDARFMPHGSLAGLLIDDADPITAVARLETRFYAGHMLLRDSDAMGMAHSLEIRVPFFDTGVLNAAFPIPPSVRFPQQALPKTLLRKAFPDLLRPEILSMSKRGFSLPISRWMSSSLRGLCEESLADLRRANILENKGIDSMWSTFLKEPGTPIWSRAFALCVMGAFITRVIKRREPSGVRHATSVQITSPARG